MPPAWKAVMGSLLLPWVGYQTYKKHRADPRWAKPEGKPGVDVIDCYFDKTCHQQVDWDKVKEVKMPLLNELKDLSLHGDNDGEVKLVMQKAHVAMVEAGVPEDRADYILSKWLQFAYPAAFDAQYLHCSIQVSGFRCDNGYGEDLNQEYHFRGQTQDDRPYYQGAERQDRFIYFDHRCADDSQEPRWILGGRPDVTRMQDLNPRDGNGCENDFGLMSESMHLPGGRLEGGWQWCGDHGYMGGAVSVSYSLQPPGAKKAAPVGAGHTKRAADVMVV